MKPAVMLVVAKAPVIGSVKTRLGRVVGMEHAAQLAAAALLDTIAVCVAAYGVMRCHLALDGDLADAERSRELLDAIAGWTVHPQRGDDFATRLVNAHEDTAAAAGAPVVQVGMDTPHLRPQTLTEVGSRLTDPDAAVIGPAFDGGWWLLGVGSPQLVRRLGDVPMSTSRTGELTRKALVRAGAVVTDIETLRDVDEVLDAESVAAAAPKTMFATAFGGAAMTTTIESAELARIPEAASSFSEVYGDALRGEACTVRGILPDDQVLPVHEWMRPVSHADRALLGHCRGATLDVGCGPGRMSAHLAASGHVVLGVDIVREAVEQARRRGVAALRRNAFDTLPGEGRWDTVLLADGNIGIGGAPVRLLRRAGELLNCAGGWSAIWPRRGRESGTTMPTWSPT